MIKYRSRVKVEAVVKSDEVIIKGLPMVAINSEESFVTPLYVEELSDFRMRIGDEITISNQMKAYKLSSIEDNKATFEKCNDFGKIIDSFYLIDGKSYLFAVTSGAARNGVVHMYYPPKDELEELFDQQGWSRKTIVTVKDIAATMRDGGRWCHHETDDTVKYWFEFHSDGDEKQIQDAQFVEEHQNQYHVGCMLTPNVYSIKGGTFAIEIERRGNGYSKCRVFKTPEACMPVVVDVVKRLLQYMEDEIK